MSGFVIARIAFVVGLIAAVATFVLYEPPMAQQRLNRLKAQLADSARGVNDAPSEPWGWFNGAGAILAFRGEAEEKKQLGKWLESLSDDVRRTHCVEGLIWARMAFHLRNSRQQLSTRMGFGPERRAALEEREAAAFDRAIEELERWRVERPERMDMFHLYSLALCYRWSGETDKLAGVVDAWASAMEAERGDRDANARAHYLSHLGEAYLEVGRLGDASGVFQRIGEMVWVGAIRPRRNDLTDSYREVVAQLLEIGDIGAVERLVSRGFGLEDGELTRRGWSGLSEWGWLRIADELDKEGQIGLAEGVRYWVLTRELSRTAEADRDGDWWYRVARLRALTGDGDGAIAALGRALEMKGINLTEMERDDALASIRDRAAFGTLVEELKRLRGADIAE